MKKMVTTICLLFASLGSHAAGPQEALTAFHAALESGNGEAALRLLAPDATIYEGGHVERSRAEYAGHHLGDDMAFAKAVPRKVLRQGQRILENQAVLWAETETAGAFKGKPVHQLGTETAVLDYKDGAWVISHIHWSSRKAK